MHTDEEGLPVAIDGETFQGAYAAELRPESEIVLIPEIRGRDAFATIYCTAHGICSGRRWS